MEPPIESEPAAASPATSAARTPSPARASWLHRISWRSDGAAREAAAPAPEGAPLRTVLVSAVALLSPRGAVLLVQQPAAEAMAGVWEFPGAEVAAGETPKAALASELTEQFGITVEEADLKPLTFASHSSVNLNMWLYECRRWRGVPKGVEGQTLQWARASQLVKFSMAAADAPLLPAVRAALSGPAYRAPAQEAGGRPGWISL